MTHIKWPNELGAPVPYEPNWHNEAMRQNALLHSAMAGGAAASKRAEQLELERDGLPRVVTDNHVALCRAEDAEAKLAKAVEALRFYADVNNYDEGIVGTTHESPMWSESEFTQFEWDNGDKARALLAELEKTE
jgi:hypothetical protein